MKTRQAAVAGRFYPGSKEEIAVQLDQILVKEKPSIDISLSNNHIIGAVVPHAMCPPVTLKFSPVWTVTRTRIGRKRTANIQGFPATRTKVRTALAVTRTVRTDGRAPGSIFHLLRFAVADRFGRTCSYRACDLCCRFVGLYRCRQPCRSGGRGPCRSG